MIYTARSVYVEHWKSIQTREVFNILRMCVLLIYEINRKASSCHGGTQLIEVFIFTAILYGKINIRYAVYRVISDSLGIEKMVH